MLIYHKFFSCRTFLSASNLCETNRNVPKKSIHIIHIKSGNCTSYN